MGFVTAWIVAGALTPGYDPIDHAISRLAEVGAPHRGIMSAGFVVFGLGVPLYAIALRYALGGLAWATAAVAGLATLGVAAFPLEGAAGNDAHAAFAAVGYGALAATPILAASELGRRRLLTWARLSWVCGLLSAICLAGSLIDPVTGLLQRLGLTLVDAWIVATSIAILRARSPSPEPRCERRAASCGSTPGAPPPARTPRPRWTGRSGG